MTIASEIFGDPRSPGWESQNLVTVRSPNGQTWRVHRLAAPSFEGLLTDLVAAGYNPTSSGGFNYRPIRGGTNLSQHAFGNAIDISAAANPMTTGTMRTDLPANTAELAAKYGLTWGGTWKNRPDPMHFEWRGPNGTGIITGPASGSAAPAQTTLSFGGSVPAAPTSSFGIANMFGDPAVGLSMGAPDPFARQQRPDPMAERQQQENEDARLRRTALLSSIGRMFA